MSRHHTLSHRLLCAPRVCPSSAPLGRTLDHRHQHTPRIGQISPPSTRLLQSQSFNAMSEEHQGNLVSLDPFALRQFKQDTSDPTSGLIHADPQEFIQKVNAIISEQLARGEELLVDGYAPFCKHIFIENFTDAKPVSIPISEQLLPLIRTSYAARTEKELPVLNRFIPESLLPAPLGAAKYLDLILYSREQIIKENEAMGNHTADTEPWGIVSIKAQDVAYEQPMNPITMMRNSLGKEHGGSGVPLDREKYMESVQFWDSHVMVSF